MTVPLQEEMYRAEGARAQGIPEFDHRLPFVPKSIKKSRSGEDITSDLKRIYDDSKKKFETTKDEMQNILDGLGLSDARKAHDKAMQELDLARWDCPSEANRIQQFKLEMKVASWLERSCRFAGAGAGSLAPVSTASWSRWPDSRRSEKKARPCRRKG